MGSSSLARLQRQLSRALTDPRGPKRHLRELRSVLVEAPPLPLSDRLEIYSYAYAARLIEALEADFSRTRKALGASRFRKLAREYLEKRPSREWTVSFVGRHLPKFLETKLRGKASRAVAQAWLDWTETQAFFAPNEEPWDPASLAQVPAESQGRIRLILSRSAVLLGERQGFRSRAHLVWRGDFQVRTQALTRAQALLIAAFQKKRPLSAALSKLSPRAQVQAASWIRDWTSQGLFSGAEV